jgi:hypothetical protein
MMLPQKFRAFAAAAGVFAVLFAVPLQASAGETSSPVLKPPVAEAAIPGWVIPQLGPPGGEWSDGRSGDGRIQVLVKEGDSERAPKRTQTSFAIVKISASGRPQKGKPRIITVDGQLGFDAVSNAGTKLFVTENRDVDAPGTYRVRVIDLASGTLDPRVLSDKPINAEALATTTTDESLMTGYAVKRVRDSLRTHWIFTLYDADGHHPFVHALNTEGWALCVDLPAHGKKTGDLALAWSLQVKDNKTVMVSNSKLGKSWSFAIGSTTLNAP